MKILVCPNAFKGSLTAHQASDTIKRGIIESGLDAEIVTLPIADGGDGTLEIMYDALALSIHSIATLNAINQPINANFGWSEKSKIGFVELAEASGIKHIDRSDLDPFRANTFGSGLIIQRLIEMGAKEILISIGGSASIDGGIGILDALGFGFYGSDDQVIQSPKPIDFCSIERIQLKEAESYPRGINFKVLCDVFNPLLGSNGAATVFGPQKGATVEEVKFLEQGLDHLAKVVLAKNGLNIGTVRCGGAAGGTAAFLYGLLNAQLMDGASEVLDLIGFQKKLSDSDMVITGEGRIDAQTIAGKGPGVVARNTKKANKYLIGIAGEIDFSTVDQKLFDELISINPRESDLETSMINCKSNLYNASNELGKRLKCLK